MPPQELKRVGDVLWELPATYKPGMRVPARIYGTEKLVREMDDGVFNQVTNVACLPGILKASYCMPDGHWGYGFPIGGVAAMDPETGVISPGGIGFDINCGMRLIRTGLTFGEVKPKLRELVDTLFRLVPAGVGSEGFVKLSRDQFCEVARGGVAWCVENGYGWPEDPERIEESGRLPGADTAAVSPRALQRGLKQMGTLGSGNHYLEIQVAQKVEEPGAAKAFGLDLPEQVCVMVHCGSRGFGHQIGTDYLEQFLDIMPKYKIPILDKELACAPFRSPEGQRYYRAMACAANMAFANRQVITHRVREAFEKVFGRDAESLGLHIVYDVAHNVAKLEKHRVNGGEREVLVHRKGSTRAFPPGRPEVPPAYRSVGQPVIIGGSMETGSYVLVGAPKGMEETFGTTCHGSGRTMSRAAAKRKVRGEVLQREMEKRGIYVKAVSYAGLAEEAGLAYKDVSEVVESMARAGVSKKVVALRPVGNIKG